MAQWWQPGTSKEANLRAGRKKDIVDIFGPWVATDSLSLADVMEFPDPHIDPEDVLEWNFDLTDAGELTFEVLDRLVDEHKIDITGLSVSSTTRGNVYRTHRLMSSLNSH